MVLTVGQGDAIRAAAKRAGHKTVSAYVRAALQTAVRADGINWPDDVPDMGVGRRGRSGNNKTKRKATGPPK